MQQVKMHKIKHKMQKLLLKKQKKN